MELRCGYHWCCTNENCKVWFAEKINYTLSLTGIQIRFIKWLYMIKLDFQDATRQADRLMRNYILYSWTKFL